MTVTDDKFEDNLEEEIRQRVEAEVAKERAERDRLRAEAQRRREEAERKRSEARSREDNAGVPSHIPLPDVDKVGELLEIVAEKVPALLGGLRDLMYSPDAAENMATSVATFYAKLKESGIPEEHALDMARGYMINVRDILGKKGLDIGRIGRDED